MPRHALRPADLRSPGEPVVLRYRPHGHAAKIDALAFADYLHATVRSLKQTANALADRRVDVRYQITRLSSSDPQVELTPTVRLADAQVVHRAQVRHVAIVRAIEGGRWPDAVDFATLQSYRRLGDIAVHHAFKVDVRANGDSAVVTERLKNVLDLELARDQWSYGSIRGRIQSYHSAGSRRLIRIYPRVGPSLLCSFASSMQARIRDLIDAFVEAEGDMRYRPAEYHPYFMKIATIRKLDTDAGPSFRDMQGAFPNIGIDRPPEETIGDARDDW